MYMKIATWNVERLKHRRELDKILNACERIQADILVLTESDRRIQPDYPFAFHTPVLSGSNPVSYAPTENRVSIYTRYRAVRQHTTYDSSIALCVELETEYGNLLVYGTIMGILGNRDPSYAQDLEKQLGDFQRLTASGRSLCVCGDYNCSFSDNYYFTKTGRAALLRVFSENGIRLLTAEISECIDHIAVSERFIGAQGGHIRFEEWNRGKRLSDHKGVAVIF